MISENLHRTGLTTEELQNHRAAWAESIMGRKREVLTHGGSKPPNHQSRGVGKGAGGGRPKGGVRAAAREMGVPLSTVQRAIASTAATKIAELSDAAAQVAEELGLANNRKALELTAAHHSSAQQVAFLQSYAEGKKLRSRSSVPSVSVVRGGRTVSLPANEKTRWLKFSTSYGTLVGVCSAAEHIQIPPLEDKLARGIVRELTKSLRSVNAFRDKLIKMCDRA